MTSSKEIVDAHHRGYVKPMDVLRILREDAVNCGRAVSFNAFLTELAFK